MKKIFLSLGIVCLGTLAALAQDKKSKKTTEPARTTMTTAVTPVAANAHTTVSATPTAATPAAAPSAPTMKPEEMAFASETHDFGTVSEGPAAEYEFSFTNKGKEPIVIQQVHASCGCTTPSYSKDPVLPGKTGTVKASFNTTGRPGSFTKTITVLSNAGSKVLTIKGEVEKAPDASAPQNTSMIKTN